MAAELPSLEELIKKGEAELLRILRAYGVTPDLSAIDAAVAVVFEPAAAAMRAGVVLDDAKWAQIDRAIELAAQKLVRIQVKAVTSEYRLSKFRRLGAPMVWIAIMDSATCDSCEGRHGKVKTMPDWVRAGLPRSPALICAAECRCELMPVPAKAGGPDPYVELSILGAEEVLA